MPVPFNRSLLEGEEEELERGDSGEGEVGGGAGEERGEMGEEKEEGGGRFKGGEEGRGEGKGEGASLFTLLLLLLLLFIRGLFMISNFGTVVSFLTNAHFVPFAISSLFSSILLIN